MEFSLERELRVPVGDPMLAQIKIDGFLVVRIGDVAPDFTATTLAGDQITLNDLRGKVVLLDFWATWCGPCVAEMPTIQRAYRRYGQDGRMIVIGISLDDDKAAVQRFLKKRDVEWAQVVLGPAEDNPVARLYNVTGIPATFLIGSDGKVVAKDLRDRELLRTLRKLLGPPARTARRD